MRSDHKREHSRKEQNRHQASKVVFSKRTEQSARQDRGGESKPEKEIKGKDIDLMNYTDI